MSDLLVESKKKSLNTTFYVINTTHKNLLSGTTAMELGIIAFAKTVNTLTSKQSREIEVRVISATDQLNHSHTKKD